MESSAEEKAWTGISEVLTSQDRRGRPQLHGELGRVPDPKKSRDKHYKFIADLN